MLDQLKLLEDLQRLDHQLQQTEQQLQALPLRLKSMQEDLNKVEALLESERQQLQEVETYRAEIDLSIKNEQVHLNKSKAKLTQVRTSKEYTAVQREFETNRRLIGEREQEMLRLGQAIEQTSNSISKHEKELEELRQHAADEERDAQAKLIELQEVVESQRAARQLTSQSIVQDLLARYDRIRRLRGGTAVVQAQNGVCTGCRMHIPPQLYNMLQRSDTVEQCPTCQRIVYVVRQDISSSSSEIVDSIETPASTAIPDPG